MFRDMIALKVLVLLLNYILSTVLERAESCSIMTNGAHTLRPGSWHAHN